MISISRAVSLEDFEIADGFCRAFGSWDAAEAQAYGVPADIVLDLFHGETAGSLAVKFSAAETALFIARWDGSPAGCLAFGPFDGATAELHKFYVDPEFRGKGIGAALMRAILSELAKGSYRRIVLQTTVYMKPAISVYQSFDFSHCPPFRPIPDSIRHTEVFMSRAI